MACRRRIVETSCGKLDVIILCGLERFCAKYQPEKQRPSGGRCCGEQRENGFYDRGLQYRVARWKTAKRRRNFSPLSPPYVRSHKLHVTSREFPVTSSYATSMAFVEFFRPSRPIITGNSHRSSAPATSTYLLRLIRVYFTHLSKVSCVQTGDVRIIRISVKQN